MITNLAKRSIKEKHFIKKRCNFSFFHKIEQRMSLKANPWYQVNRKKLLKGSQAFPCKTAFTKRNFWLEKRKSRSKSTIQFKVLFMKFNCAEFWEQNWYKIENKRIFGYKKKYRTTSVRAPSSNSTPSWIVRTPSTRIDCP